MLIAITGYKQSGKDTLAGILVERYGFYRRAFADPLKEMALAIDPYVQPVGSFAAARLSEVVRIRGWEVAKESADVRRFLQRLGKEGVRDHIGQDTWVNLWLRDIEGHENVVVPDMRFLNEAAAVRERGGRIWRVVRDGQVSTDTHASETEMASIDADLIIHNTTLDRLRDVVAMALARS